MGDIIVGFSVVFLFICCVLVTVTAIKKVFHTITVYEHERGLKYYKGRLVEEVEAGFYAYISHSTEIVKIDMRPTQIAIAGQEIITMDGVPIKLSLICNYQVIDAKKAISNSSDYLQGLYSKLQLILREIITHMSVEEVLQGRNTINDKLKMILNDAEELGLNILSVNLKDVILTGEYKKSFMKVSIAKKEALAQLEKARGEAAVLRSLANTAKMLEKNPALMQLRVIQALGDTTGNSVVFNISEAPAVSDDKQC